MWLFNMQYACTSEPMLPPCDSNFFGAGLFNLFVVALLVSLFPHFPNTTFCEDHYLPPMTREGSDAQEWVACPPVEILHSPSSHSQIVPTGASPAEPSPQPGSTGNGFQGSGYQGSEAKYHPPQREGAPAVPTLLVEKHSSVATFWAN